MGATETSAPAAGAMPVKADYRTAALVLLLYMVDGIDMQLLGVTVAPIASAWGLPLSNFGIAMAAGHAGAAIGAVTGGMLGDRFGHRPVVIGGIVLFALLSMAVALATTPAQIAVLRFIAGLGLGGCLPPALALLTESMPDRRRRLAVAIAMLCTSLGIATAGLVAAVLLPVGGWRALFVFGGLLPLVLAALFLVVPPYAEGRSANGSARPTRPVGNRGSLGTLLRGPLRGPTWRLLGIFFTAFFAMSMILSWLPAVMVRTGLAANLGHLALSTWSLAGMPGVIIAGLLMTRWRLRGTVALSMAGGAIAFAAMATILTNPDLRTISLPLLVAVAVGGFMLNSTATSIYAYAAELFPANLRASGIGLAATTGRLGAISGAFSGAYLLERFGTNGFFAFAAGLVCVALALFAVWDLRERASGQAMPG